MHTDTIKGSIPHLSHYAPPWIVREQKAIVERGEQAEDRALARLTPILRACANGSDKALMGREIKQCFDVDASLLLEVS